MQINAQNHASSANWLYPDGNSEGTRYVKTASIDTQTVNEFKVKWATDAIAGDVKPLIGNIIANQKMNSGFPNFPNEIVAYIADKLVVVNAAGKTVTKTEFPEYVYGINNVSMLFDTTSSLGNEGNSTGIKLLGLETMEIENLSDTVAYAFVSGFNQSTKEFEIIYRMAIDLRIYKPNYFASIKPVFGKTMNGQIMVYATVNMSSPTSTSANPVNPPFFRGLTQFNSSYFTPNYPLPDVGDDLAMRLTYGPEVNFSQPSISYLNGTATSILLPTYPTTSMSVKISNSIMSLPTYTEDPYLIGADISGAELAQGMVGTIQINNLIATGNNRSQIRSYYVNLSDEDFGAVEDTYILVAEEYRGIDSSTGTPRLHLFDKYGTQLTYPSGTNLSVKGGSNHLWSVAVGDLDGTDDSHLENYYKNNPGKEIIVTYSSREFSIGDNKLMVLRYKSGEEVAKPTPPGTFLNKFDTICTSRINGWVAAVNNIDKDPMNKDEIILVDGSSIKVLRLKSYGSIDFRSGKHFDTLFTYTFPNQTISNVAVADLEGDGLNDIIVTTFDSTYVLGKIMKNSLVALQPKNIPNESTIDMCAGDTLQIKWTNIVRSFDGVNIKFQPVINGVKQDTIITIQTKYPNNADTVSYYYVADSLLLGMEGYFIIENSYEPNRVYDSTSFVHFNIPHIVMDNPSLSMARVGDIVFFTGMAFCVDSVALSYSYKSDTTNTWTELKTDSVEKNQKFTMYAEMPCVKFYRCDERDLDTFLLVRAIGIRGIYRDTAAPVEIYLKPKRLPVEFDSCETICQTREFRWDLTGIEYDCETINILISYDCCKTFTMVESVPVKDGKYTWNVPTNLPDCVGLRFCCENSCIRLDTIVQETKVKYINTVAPNPFKPPENVEVVYSVPTNTNVTIRIFDQNNRLVAEPVKNQSRNSGIAYCDRWDGTIWDGSYAANGIYYLSLEMSNGSKEVYPVFVRK